ncbi:MAG: signal peptidase II [Anaerolineae bacterium]|nr:signal peptidase II [Anaerolineae bacterium]
MITDTETVNIEPNSDERTGGDDGAAGVKLELKEYMNSYAGLLFLAGAVIWLDQWTKALVRSQLSLSETWMPLEWLAPYARIVHWRNRGAAFGMFQEAGGIFTVLAVVVAGIIIYYYPRVPKKDWLFRLALALQLGGALGNLIDRISFGYVTDFLSVGNFPVFNVADSSISVGVGLLLLGSWLSDRAEKKARLDAGGPEMEEAPSSG